MTVHAHDRAGQRYNQDVPITDLSCMAFEITKGNSFFIEKIDKFMSFHYVLLRNIPYKVLFSTRRRMSDKTYQNKPSIITVYPFDADEYNRITKDYQDRRINDNIEELKHLGYKIFKEEIEL